MPRQKKVAKQLEKASLWENLNEMGQATSAQRGTNKDIEIHEKEEMTSEIVRGNAEESRDSQNEEVENREETKVETAQVVPVCSVHVR